MKTEKFNLDWKIAICCICLLFQFSTLQAQTRGWGSNRNGEIGIGNKTKQSQPQIVMFVPDATAISSGKDHTLFLKADGTVLASGFNNQCQFGDGTRVSSDTPVPVKNLTNVIQISGGWHHSVALKSDGTVWTWGYNDSGQLGNETELDDFSPTPSQVKISDVVQIDAGLSHTLALKADGTVWAWGNNRQGQLGTGNTFDSEFPVQVGSSLEGFNDIIDVSAGGYSLALKADGTVWEWGEFLLKQEAKPQRWVIVPYPEQNPFLKNVVQISARANDSRIALTSDGKILTWGNKLTWQIQSTSEPEKSYRFITTKNCSVLKLPPKLISIM